jgi:hypothetical protein
MTRIIPGDEVTGEDARHWHREREEIKDERASHVNRRGGGGHGCTSLRTMGLEKGHV